MRHNLNNSSQISTLYHDLERQKETLHNQIELGIITISDAETELNNLNNKQKALIKKTVDRLHICSDGTPRKISQYGEDKNYLWNTRVSRDKRITAKTLDELYLKLYDFYTANSLDFSVESIFTIALNEKEVSENPKTATITKYRNDFKRFISDELANTDIHSITGLDLKKYTQNFVRSSHPTEKNFLAYKCILNLIFDYAHRNGIIPLNPVREINNRVYMKDCEVVVNRGENKIFSQDEIKMIETYLREKVMTENRYHGYCYNAYAILFSIKTGLRAGEICSLRWSDIDYNNHTIHIHTQQLEHKVKGKKTTHYLVNYTKDERGKSRGGRMFPLTDSIIEILDELKSVQSERNIRSEFVFCNDNGEWLTSSGYESFVFKICRKLNLNSTNNHAFRMSLNSSVLIPMDIPAKERADLLGHSVLTNINYYTFSEIGYVDNIRQKMNRLNL